MSSEDWMSRESPRLGRERGSTAPPRRTVRRWIGEGESENFDHRRECASEHAHSVASGVAEAYVPRIEREDEFLNGLSAGFQDNASEKSRHPSVSTSTLVSGIGAWPIEQQARPPYWLCVLGVFPVEHHRLQTCVHL